MLKIVCVDEATRVTVRCAACEYEIFFDVPRGQPSRAHVQAELEKRGWLICFISTYEAYDRALWALVVCANCNDVGPFAGIRPWLRANEEPSRTPETPTND